MGKTTVFNQLTGMLQHVGNWPGKTVERAEGSFTHGDYEYDIIDLPGNYALSAHSIEEIVSRDFIVDDNSDVIINVVDADNLERNLYLTVQMMELGANLVLALNMNDFARKRGHIINLELMEELLGIIGSFFAPVFAPLGFGTWQAAVAIIAGLASKEVVVATFGTLAGMEATDNEGITNLIHDTFTPLSAMSFMAFTLLYTPCVAAIAAVKQESNSYRWALTMCLITVTTAFVVSFLIFQVGTLLGFA